MKLFQRIACISAMLALWALPAHLEQTAVLTTIASNTVLSNSASITWESIVPGSSWVDYGQTTDYGKTMGDPSPSTSHLILLTGLENSRIYHYRVRSVDALGNTMSSADQTFQTTQGVRDDIAPAAINDLRVVDQSFTSATIEWTATGDDGISGTAARYDMRRSSNDNLLRNETWFTQTQVMDVPAPLLAGTKQRYTFTNLQPDTLFFVALRPVDEASNIAQPSNVVAILTEPSSTGAFAIKGVHFLNRTSTSVMIQWSTMVPATTEPLFGKSIAYEIPMPANSRKTFDHTVIISNLDAGTTYHFKIQATNENGDTASTGDLEVQTLP